MVHIYNRLPQKTIDKKTVSDFQRDLTFIARASCREGVQDWQSCFSVRLQSVFFMHVVLASDFVCGIVDP